MAERGLDRIELVGAGLVRPECVLATRSGDLFTADWRGGVAHLDASGRQTLYTGACADLAEPLRPNGIALEPDGSFLVAQLGAETGGVWRLGRDGSLRPFLLEVDGAPLPPTNFVGRDHQGRHWVTVSTRRRPRDLAYRPGDGDGFVVLVERGAARIVADGLGYTNEAVASPDGSRLYVNETFARQTSVLEIAGDRLGKPAVLASYGPGTFPDGLALDSAGGVWVVSVVSNRLIRIAPGGAQEILIEDVADEHLAAVQAAFEAGRMGRPELDAVRSRKLRNISSVAFGGADLRTLWLGCLLGDQLARTSSPVAGLAPPHWLW